MELVIERGIPLPMRDRRTNASGAPLGSRWDSLNAGDSTLLPTEAARCAALAWARAHGRIFTSRKVKGGWRVWRVE